MGKNTIYKYPFSKMFEDNILKRTPFYKNPLWKLFNILKIFNMKKIIFYFVLLILFFQNLTGQNNILGRLDFNVGFQYINDIKLNEILETKNLPKVNSLNSVFGFNLDVNFKKFIFSPEFALINSTTNKDDYSTKVSGLVGTIGLGYSLLINNNDKVSLLGFVSAIPTVIKISYDKSSIDISSLDPKINSGLVNLNYTPINFGINLRSSFFNDSTFPLGISISYEFGIRQPEIKSDYATILNSIKEKGERISVKLSVPLKKYRKS